MVPEDDSNGDIPSGDWKVNLAVVMTDVKWIKKKLEKDFAVRCANHDARITNVEAQQNRQKGALILLGALVTAAFALAGIIIAVIA